ncbi:MAG: DUF4349 domain-containing protein [Thermoleophilia bacterium]
MTDDREQQELIDLIERLLAGETVAAAGGREDELEKLLAIAAELNKRRPEPSAEFEERLEARMAGLKTATAVTSDDTADASPGDGVTAPGAATGMSIDGKSWLRTWLSMPRLAAVAAALVIGLGVIGMGGAIIRGGYQGKTATVSDVASDTRTPADDVKNLENATGQSAAGRSGEIAAGDAAGSPSGDIAGSGSTAGMAGVDTVVPLPSTQRIIQSADYQVEVAQGEFNYKYSQISAIAAKYGGYVVSGDTRASGDELKRGSITIRVASANDNFTKAQADLDALGNVTSRKVSGQDVTEEYVDLQSRLRNAEAQETQMLELMKKAQTIEEILTVQSRLAEIQSQIEQIKGRMKYMESRTDFATITVDLREMKEGVDVTESGGTNWGFVDSLKYAGWLAVQTLNFVIVALAVIAPLTLMGGGLAILFYRLAQWRRNRKK